MSDEPIQSFASVWDALADTPEQAANMRLRAELVLAIQEAVEGWAISRARAAERLRRDAASSGRAAGGAAGPVLRGRIGHLGRTRRAGGRNAHRPRRGVGPLQVMNEAETRAELIDPALKAAGWGVVEASRVRREVIVLVRQPGASRPSSHIHGIVIIGYPTRNIPRLIEDVGDHRRRPGKPGEPIAMQLDPAKPIPRQLRIGPWMCQPEIAGRPRSAPTPRRMSQSAAWRHPAARADAARPEDSVRPCPDIAPGRCP